MLSRKRELLARGLLSCGAPYLAAQLPSRTSLLVLNYHRIGNPEDDPFDSDLITATAEQFDQQLAYLKRQVSLITLEEALAFLDGTAKERHPRCRVLITFDDGYVDNYQIALPILNSHGVQGVFFLVTGMVGSGQIPWWDRLAYLMKTARQRRFTLRYPGNLNVDIDQNGVMKSIADVNLLYRSSDQLDSSRFLLELTEKAQGEDPVSTVRRFLNWAEAREMLDAGMAIGSHTHTHPALSQLGRDEQRNELVRSRQVLREKLDIDVKVLAYPFGGLDSFSDETQQLAQEVGYRIAFSFCGGTNRPGMTSRYNVRRVGVEDQSWQRFRVRTAVCRAAGNYWP